MNVKALLLIFYVLALSTVAFLVIDALRSDSGSTSWVLALIWAVALVLIVRVTSRVFSQ